MRESRRRADLIIVFRCRISYSALTTSSPTRACSRQIADTLDSYTLHTRHTHNNRHIQIHLSECPPHRDVRPNRLNVCTHSFDILRRSAYTDPRHTCDQLTAIRSDAYDTRHPWTMDEHCHFLLLVYSTHLPLYACIFLALAEELGFVWT